MFYNACVSVVIAYVNLKRYEFVCNDNRLEYYFDSVGPKGVIRKVVRFEQAEIGNPLFNLGFGDLDSTTHLVKDTVRSNNGDREMIMATIAAIVLDFSRSYPESLLYASGYNKARTRLYQMAIASHFREISLMFHVFGYVDNSWERFKTGRNYESFYVEKRLNLKTK
jgi:hypothetical protein